MTASIDVTRVDEVAEVVINQPARRNAISAAMWERLAGLAGDQAVADARCIVVRGAGETFSAGADIAGFEDRRQGNDATSYDDLVEHAVRMVERLPMPTIAAIAGPCIGAGASLALACDLRVAEEGAFFAVPAARLGLGYDPRGISRFRRILGEVATRELLYTAGRLPSERAFALGAVSRLVAPGEGHATASALARTVAANAPLTVRAAKRALADLAEHASKTSPEATDMARIADRSADYAEGRAAFAEKRPPRFSGC